MSVAVMKNVKQPINGTTVFDFGSDHTVVAYTVGLSGIQVCFPDHDNHHVQSFSIDLQSVSTDPGGGGTPTGPSVVISTNFIGSRGNQADPNPKVSFIGVACLAVLDDADSDIVLQNQTTSSDGTVTPASVQLPNDGTDVPIAFGGIAGFDLDFGSDAEKISDIKCTMGLSVTQTEATINPTAWMKSSEKLAPTATADGAVILADSNAENSAFAVTLVQGNTKDDQTFTFDKEVDQAVTMLQSFHAYFDDNTKYSLCEISIESPKVEIDQDDNTKVTVSHMDNYWMCRCEGGMVDEKKSLGTVNYLLITTFKDQSD